MKNDILKITNDLGIGIHLLLWAIGTILYLFNIFSYSTPILIAMGINLIILIGLGGLHILDCKRLKFYE